MSKKSHAEYPFNPSLVELEKYVTYAPALYGKDKRVRVKEELGDKEYDLIEVDKPKSIEELIAPTKKDVRDNQAYYKVYSGSNDEKLSKTAYKLLKYIMDNLKPKQDLILLHRPFVMGKLGWKSRMNYHNAIVELLDSEFIYKSAVNDESYYINVCKVFNGDRTKPFLEFKKYKEGNGELINDLMSKKNNNK